jgi:septal ring factor EnvC (AmiA/AmiB activator)
MKGGHRLLSENELLRTENAKLKLLVAMISSELEHAVSSYERELGALRRSLHRNLDRVRSLDEENRETTDAMRAAVRQRDVLERELQDLRQAIDAYEVAIRNGGRS